MDPELLDQAAQMIDKAEALLITAGAGMGVDSGLPDFRGNAGFWKAYPPYKKLGKSFVEMANPRAFGEDPAFAWGFYGHRLNLYRETQPHLGFELLGKWSRSKGGNAFVMTSNVDGHFQKAGFPEDSIYEVHGSIHHLQCYRPCEAGQIWTAQELNVEIDEATMRATTALPACPDCGAVARPNILMFGDWSYLSDRNTAQEERLQTWLDSMEGKNVAVLELGAGTAVPTVRHFSERTCMQMPKAGLVRINPREADIPLQGNHVSLSGGSLEVLHLLDKRVTGQLDAMI